MIPNNIYEMPNSEILFEIGSRIRKHRHFMRLTQKELAANSGVGEPTIKNLEAHRVTNVSLNTLLDLLRALDALDHVLDIIPDIDANPYNISEKTGKGVLRIRKKKDRT